ncbi:MAG TPA: 30S ribosomal protein S12 methylthiotransferase RimO [Rectinemataceae bacterium]|nr:30S ribosomal protein S12 methylthiotransferase RimO [Rectinemataceae bacterium]
MRFWIDRHGCAKNQVDGEEMLSRLEAAGHLYVDSPEGAELIIVNTCGFIEDAKKESIDAVIGLKAAHPKAKVLVAGCLAERYSEALSSELPEADGIVGNADLGAIIEAAEETAAGHRPVLLPHAAPSLGTVTRKRLFDFPGTAHVKITEGCSNNCSYCAIPLIRGSLRSRPVAEVVAECSELVARGIGELVLIGQDLGSYGRDSGSSRLPELLSALSALEGDFRVRVLYIHPDNFPEAILPVMAADPRLLAYFDLPFQHASAPILKAMHRRGDAAAYLGLIARIRSALPEAVLRSTVLVGFPGETEEDFRRLLEFQAAARLDWLGSFAFSREEGTAAFDLKGRVPKKVVAERRRRVEEAQEGITRERLERFVGQSLEVIVEEPVETDPDGDEDGEPLSIGRAWLQAPEVDGLTVLRGRFEPGARVLAKVLGVRGVDLEAMPLQPADSTAPRRG